MFELFSTVMFSSIIPLCSYVVLMPSVWNCHVNSHEDERTGCVQTFHWETIFIHFPNAVSFLYRCVVFYFLHVLLYHGAARVATRATIRRPHINIVFPPHPRYLLCWTCQWQPLWVARQNKDVSIFSPTLRHTFFRFCCCGRRLNSSLFEQQGGSRQSSAQRLTSPQGEGRNGLHFTKLLL